MKGYPVVHNVGSYIGHWLWMWWWIPGEPYGEEYCCWCRSGKSGNILWYLFLSLFSKSYRSWSCMAPPITLFYVICKILNISKYLLLVKYCVCLWRIKSVVVWVLLIEWKILQLWRHYLYNRNWKAVKWREGNRTYDTFYNKCAKSWKNGYGTKWHNFRYHQTYTLSGKPKIFVSLKF